MVDFFIDAFVFLLVIAVAALFGLIAAEVLYQLIEWRLNYG